MLLLPPEEQNGTRYQHRNDDKPEGTFGRFAPIREGVQNFV